APARSGVDDVGDPAGATRHAAVGGVALRALPHGLELFPSVHVAHTFGGVRSGVVDDDVPFVGEADHHHEMSVGAVSGSVELAFEERHGRDHRDAPGHVPFEFG